LLTERHRYVRYDGRGFGLSERSLTDFSLDARVRDLEAVVDAAALERFAIVAASAGGPTGIAFTARHPERVSRLVLASTLAGARSVSAETRERTLRMFEMFRLDWDSPVVRSMAVEWLDPDADEVSRRVVSELLRRSGEGPKWVPS
jgi:pimeloyl-ACP methyl ester carboxylesterase